MATLDDKLLGEKLHYYCSSSSESEGEDDENDNGNTAPTQQTQNQASSSNGDKYRWDGTSTNTGPKGVMKDFQRFKQLEREHREEQKDELAKLAKKFSITCRTNAEDEKAKSEEDKVEEELADLMDDDFIQEYLKQRMQEMLNKESSRRKFGRVHALANCEQFLAAVDEEDKFITVVVLLYEPISPGCTNAVKAIEGLANGYPHIKFCSVRPSLISMSINFKMGGVPALLAYKGGQLVGNFVRLTDELGQEFESSDLESYLIEHGVISDRNLVSPVANVVHDSSDDD
uniref:EOG090X08Y3 n=1 Tax=Moina brachiata TaxID=675436 RepID=A0A4Y7NKI5_9CRUS|nr:EOG090X08Y3 [Moina brachiata]